jgi:putative peptidoglycan lipid II flippase
VECRRTLVVTELYRTPRGYNGQVSKAPSKTPPRTGKAAAFVAAGILVSRLVGLVRTRAFAHYFGLSDEGDAFAAGFRIPNFLQNLFGEGALSGSFIPVYAGLLARADQREAARVAGAVASILALLVSSLVLVGVFASSLLIDIIAPGFSGSKRDLTIQIVRVLFPGAGLLVLSAWCLGVLNSHHRFFLSYAAPVMWNVAMIVTLIVYGGSALPALAVKLAWGSVAGSALQFAVQFPTVLRLAPDLRFAFDTASSHVRTVVRNFVPVFISRGVVQVSAYVDALIASLLPTGAVVGLTNAQLLYTLPVSLFGISVSAAELPAMAGALGADPKGDDAIRRRLNSGLRQIAFFVVPSAVAFIALGDVVAGGILQTGRFRHSDAIYVWGILAGSGIGLLASTLGRLYSSTYYALRDTRTPLRYALVRVGLTTILGYVFAIPLPRAMGIPEIWGAAGLTASAGIAGWVEMLMLRRTLNSRIGQTGLPLGYVAKLWAAALAGAVAGWVIKLVLPIMHPALSSILILSGYGVVFLGMALVMRVPDASAAISRLRRRV